MGDRDPITFRHEGEPAHARRRGKGFYAAGGIAQAHILAARPGNSAIITGGKRIDPFAFFIRDLLNAAILGGRHHAAITASGDEFLPMRRPQEWKHQDAPRCTVRPRAWRAARCRLRAQALGLAQGDRPPRPARRRQSGATWAVSEAGAMICTLALARRGTATVWCRWEQETLGNLVYLQTVARSRRTGGCANRGGSIRRWMKFLQQVAPPD